MPIVLPLSLKLWCEVYFTWFRKGLICFNTLETVKIVYRDTDSIQFKPITPFIPFKKYILKYVKYIITFILVIILFIHITFDYWDLPIKMYYQMSFAVTSSYNTIKLRKTRSKNNWNELVLKFGNKVFSRTLFETKFILFWESVKNQFNNNNHMFILLKIKYANNEFSTIGKVQRLTELDKDWYINWIINNMDFKSEYYTETQIDSITISYGFKSGKIINLRILSFLNKKLKE